MLKVGHVTPSQPLWPNFAHFLLVPLVIHMCAKFEVSSFNRSQDMEVVTKFKNWAHDPLTNPFDLILHFFRYRLSWSIVLSQQWIEISHRNLYLQIDFHNFERMQSLNLNSEVDFRLNDCRLEKSI